MRLQNGLVLTQGLQSITVWTQIYEVRIRHSLEDCRINFSCKELLMIHGQNIKRAHYSRTFVIILVVQSSYLPY